MGAQLSTVKTSGPPYQIAYLGPGPKDKESPVVSGRKGHSSDETGVFKVPPLPSKCFSGTPPRKDVEELQDLQSKVQPHPITISNTSTPRVFPPLSKCGSPPAPKTNKHTFIALPREVRSAILSFALPSNRAVIPYYNECSVHIPFNIFNDAAPSNIPSSLLCVSRQVTAEALYILYGTNKFIFYDPRPASWFCKRIGIANLQMINTMQLFLSTGYVLDFRKNRKVLELSSFDVPFEIRWAAFVRWLRGKHALLRLSVTFEDWVGWDPSFFNWATGRSEGGVNVDSVGRKMEVYKEEEFAKLQKWRTTVVAALLRLRVFKARIARGVYFAKNEALTLRNVMEGHYDCHGDEKVDSVVMGEVAGAESVTVGDDTVVETGDDTLVQTEDVPGPEEVDMRDTSAELVEMEEGPLPELIEVKESPAPESVEMKEGPLPELIEVREDPAAEPVDIEEGPLPELIEVKENPAPELLQSVGDLLTKLGDDLPFELGEMGG